MFLCVILTTHQFNQIVECPHIMWGQMKSCLQGPYCVAAYLLFNVSFTVIKKVVYFVNDKSVLKCFYITMIAL